jgi:hypothetical protein
MGHLIDRTNDALELLQLGDLRNHIDCLLTDIPKEAASDPTYRIQPALWQSVKEIPNDVPSLLINIEQYFFDQKPSHLVELLRVIRRPINARYNELMSFLDENSHQRRAQSEPVGATGPEAEPQAALAGGNRAASTQASRAVHSAPPGEALRVPEPDPHERATAFRDFKARCKAEGIKMNEPILANLARPTWHSRYPIAKWKQCKDRRDDDAKIRTAMGKVIKKTN